MRNLLKDMKEGANILSDSNKGFYLDKLSKLEAFCPKEKLGELNIIREIITEKNTYWSVKIKSIIKQQNHSASLIFYIFR